MSQEEPSAEELIAELDREDGPLGPRHTRSECLEGLLCLLLMSRQPMHLIWGDEGALIYNDAFVPILLDKHPWAMGRPIHEVFPELYRDRLQPMVEAAMQGESLIATDVKANIDRRGYLEEIWLTISLTPICASEGAGEVEGLLAIVLETTDRSMESHRSEVLEGLSRVLRSSSSRDEMMRYGTPRIAEAVGAEMVALCKLSRRGHVARVQRSWSAPGFPVIPPEINLSDLGEGIEKELRAGRRVGITDLAPAEDDATRGSIIDRLGLRSFMIAPVLLENEIHSLVLAADRASRQWLSTEGQLLQECADLLSIHIDRKVKMDELAASEKWYRHMLEASPHLLWVRDDDATFEFLNEVWTAYTGLSEMKLKKNFMEFLHPDERDRLMELWGDKSRKDHPVRWRARYRRHDGTYRWFEVHAKPHVDANGSRVWMGTSTDIHDLVEAEEEIQRLREELRRRDSGH